MKKTLDVEVLDIYDEKLVNIGNRTIKKENHL